MPAGGGSDCEPSAHATCGPVTMSDAAATARPALTRICMPPLGRLLLEAPTVPVLRAAEAVSWSVHRILTASAITTLPAVPDRRSSTRFQPALKLNVPSVTHRLPLPCWLTVTAPTCAPLAL